MLNVIAVEGLVTKGRWSFGGVMFVRLACYPDPGRSIKRSDGQDAPDYITLRCEGLLALAAANLEEGDRVQAHGALTSRDYEIDLATFAHKARGVPDDLERVREFAPTLSVAMPHILTEILVERLVVVERRQRTEARVAVRSADRRPGSSAPRSAPRIARSATQPAAAASPSA